MLTQNYPGARSALLVETSLQGSLAEKGAGALRVMPSSRGTRQAPRWPGLMQPLIPSLPDKRVCACPALGGHRAPTVCSALPSKTSLNSPQA